MKRAVVVVDLATLENHRVRTAVRKIDSTRRLCNVPSRLNPRDWTLHTDRTLLQAHGLCLARDVKDPSLAPDRQWPLGSYCPFDHCLFS